MCVKQATTEWKRERKRGRDKASPTHANYYAKNVHIFNRKSDIHAHLNTVRKKGTHAKTLYLLPNFNFIAHSQRWARRTRVMHTNAHTHVFIRSRRVLCTRQQRPGYLWYCFFFLAREVSSKQIRDLISMKHPKNFSSIALCKFALQKRSSAIRKRRTKHKMELERVGEERNKIQNKRLLTKF